MHDDAAAPPSPWLVRWAHLIAARGRVLDVACGSGRHLRWLAARGLRVTGVDRDRDALRRSTDLPGVELIEADLEAAAWPLGERRFDAVVVANYLWRPLLPRLVAAVDSGGVLIYETFAVGNECFGKPSNPAFLLRPGELLGAVAPLRVVAYEDGFADAPPRRLQRIVALREDAALSPGDGRHPLLT